MSRHTRIAVCGAGIAGIATAHCLATRFPENEVVLIDRLQAMALTTSRSGENFRDYWPQQCMAALAGRSIDLMEELAEGSGNGFDLRFTGYEFVSEYARRDIFPSRHLRDRAQSRNLDRLTGDISLSRPYLSPDIRQVVRIKRAGAMDVHALGSQMLASARAAGLRFRRGSIESIERDPVSGFRLHMLKGSEASTMTADKVVLATGPFIKGLASGLGIQLDVDSYLQRKFIIPDPAGVIPRDMPFTIFADPQYLAWSDAESVLIDSHAEYRWLLEEFPAGLHIKTEPGGKIKLGWAYNREPEEPRWDPGDAPDFPNVVLRGASRFIPGLADYVDAVPTPVVQYSGYYTRTRENWPLIGPLDDSGLYAVGALSGYGTMVACAAGELCADWIMGEPLPAYARHFHPDRYGDAEVMADIDAIESDGQL